MEKRTAEEILCNRLGYDNREQLDQAVITGSTHVDWILEAMEEYREEHRIVLDSSANCTCTGDQYGWIESPNCIIHGKNRR